MGRAEGQELCVASRGPGMPRNDRRNAHRYALARDKIRLGWWQGQHFPTIFARLRNLSVSGALVQLEEGAVVPAGVKAWICLADQSATHWVQAEVVEVCPELPETPCVVRLKFLDAFPYESFKTAVWDDGLAREARMARCRHAASVPRRKLRQGDEPRRDDPERAHSFLLATRR